MVSKEIIITLCSNELFQAVHAEVFNGASQIVSFCVDRGVVVYVL